MGFTITHRMGDMENNPPLEHLSLDELGHNDPEHPDVAVGHESGWTLSAYPDGLVVWEDIEGEDEPRHIRAMPRNRLLELFRAVALGAVDVLESEDWVRGYP